MSVPGAGRQPLVSISEEPATSADVQWCFAQYYAELERRFEGGFSVHVALPLGTDELTPPRGLVLIARHRAEPVGCGAVKLADPVVAEIKRMWVSERLRGQGVGSRLLSDLEGRARGAGKRLARLETNRSLVEAIAMYRSRGYREVAPFNDERYGDHWFEKDLDPSPSGEAGDTIDTAAKDQDERPDRQRP